MLTSKIKNIDFNNPILVASGTYGYGPSKSKVANRRSQLFKTFPPTRELLWRIKAVGR